MKSKKEITIYDIAQKLALSSTTVSRGLHDHPAINKNTRKIQDAAKSWVIVITHLPVTFVNKNKYYRCYRS